MQDATKDPPGAHSHEVTLTPQQVYQAKSLEKGFVLMTTTGAGHQHTITVFWRRSAWRIGRCDEYDTNNHRCRDMHGKFLVEVPGV